jgi:hypothetical protein
MSSGAGKRSTGVWGLLTAGAGLIASALFSTFSAVIHQPWRIFALALLGASVLLFLLLLVFAKFA